MLFEALELNQHKLRSFELNSLYTVKIFYVCFHRTRNRKFKDDRVSAKQFHIYCSSRMHEINHVLISKSTIRDMNSHQAVNSIQVNHVKFLEQIIFGDVDALIGIVQLHLSFYSPSLMTFKHKISTFKERK